MHHRQDPPLRLRERLRSIGYAVGTLAAALLFGAQGASAAPFVKVTYDLSDSSAVSVAPLLDVTTTIPPQGTISGTQTLRYASDSASGLVTGPVSLLSFNLYVHATVGTYVYGTAGLTFTTLQIVDLHFSFKGLTASAAVGQLLSGGTITPLGASGVFGVTGSLHCFQLCGAIGAPVTTTVPIVSTQFTAPLPRLTGAMGTPHTVQGTASGVRFFLKPQGGQLGVLVTGTTFIVGREIARTPEPSTLPLVAGGLAGLGIATAAWRQRARRK